MLKQRPFLIETLTAVGLIAAPFVLPHLGFAPNTVNRILVWGLFGVGFDILFGFTTLHFTDGWSLYLFIALCYFIGIVIALRIVRSPVGAILSAIRDNSLRAAALGHNVHGYKLTAFVIAAAYAGFAGGLLGVLQAFMPPDAF